MSADEIRRLADSNATHKLRCRASEKFPRCREWCPPEDSKKCKEADEIRAALLAYAAMVERCEEVMNGKYDCEMRDVWGVGDVYTSDTVMSMQNYILKGETDGK